MGLPLWQEAPLASVIGDIAMYQRVFRTQGDKPAEEIHKLLAETRVRHDRFRVTLGSPPFERDGLNKIVGIRLRFTSVGGVTAVAT